MTMKLLMGLAMAGLISANSSVTSMFLLGLDPSSLEASIVGNDATATTYSITCAPSPTTTASNDEDEYDCGLGPGLTLTDMSPTTIWELNEKPNFSYTVNCSLAGTTSAVCTAIAAGPDANFPGTTIGTVQQSEMVYVPVTITAGSTTSAAASASATTTSESGSKGAASTTHTSKSSASSSGSSSSSSAVSTGGMPQITGDGGMLFGGAVIALAAAVL
ncbi:hypothetical protein BDV23DRAFT_166542 [Aspergillus alliaceus]|uniref:Uncharacterized protein n=1 Tax=Petromyces alliaceus TaxID=209559 RepID=A0A5N7BS02_PETAA|nr:uncharacterized protein BDW43DRAFT_269279 [Aspergillus alliaceus]KAB8235624.1 hypothetical protein BDW43DRAFT_269279 [Aspergillus alliaceus]KAE8384602.1 hypothetical protein BDV23DRAFT_166542 [Aspergillus alliaceus]